ncbi:Hypothetical predicted protein [Mytilus galloprovincialis]|uniref:Integrase catalytic domain-containing protein n=1 Tax=Mytilus galloprovincialis TaxID=29158 RepID=A0A8B6GE55_MYTGA|nr:Hypothetical predicted protein [Mytilus galloprovincialis]
MSKIKDKYHWYNMTKDINLFVLSCDTCNKNKKASRHSKCPLTKYHAGYPMERVHIDFMGPLPKTKQNNEHILMMTDQFTKWTECIPLPSQTAEVTAQAAINEFFTRFGYPFQLFSDQGRNFESALFKAVCDLLQIHKARTTPYRPQSNGQVERQNRSLMDAVRCFVDSQQENWDQHIAQLGGAMRSSVNRSTGYTPNKLMLGRETNQPADLMFGSQSEKEGLRKIVPAGDLVYVLDTAQIKGKCKKLGSPWKGPGIVISKVTGYVYKVKLQRVVFNTNHDRLKPCGDRKIPAWLETCRDKFKQGIDVLAGNKTKPTTPQYCVCRGPDTGETMVQCDNCREWFHLTCIGMSIQEANEIDPYICPNCQLVRPNCIVPPF